MDELGKLKNQINDLKDNNAKLMDEINHAGDWDNNCNIQLQQCKTQIGTLINEKLQLQNQLVQCKNQNSNSQEPCEGLKIKYTQLYNELIQCKRDLAGKTNYMNKPPIRSNPVKVK